MEPDSQNDPEMGQADADSSSKSYFDQFPGRLDAVMDQAVCGTRNPRLISDPV